MKIEPMGFFATPENLDALMFNQEQYSGGEKTAFTVGMGLTWNYLASQINAGPETWFSSHWDEHPEFTVADWKYEVDNDDTRQGYHDWVQAQLDNQ